MPRLLTLLAALFFLAGCSNEPPAVKTGGSTAGSPVLPTPLVLQPLELTFSGVGEVGIFDASLTIASDGLAWMSYSAVEVPLAEGRIEQINTHLAYSLDGGVNWLNAGLINQSYMQPLPEQTPVDEALWVNEVPSLVYDEYAPEERDWILFWHKYLKVIPSGASNATGAFQHGWIAMKTASDASGVWANETKLFTGALYDQSNSSAGSAPLFQLAQLGDDLTDCLAFTEPGALVQEEGLYIALKCSTGREGGRIVLIRCAHDFSSCHSLGAFLSDLQASQLAPDFNGFSAPELFEAEGEVYLFVTPTSGEAKIYNGCLLFRVSNLGNASLEPSGQALIRLEGAPGSFSGACSYNPAIAGGIVYNQANLSGPTIFRLFQSFAQP